jgi:hypothetical protein
MCPSKNSAFLGFIYLLEFPISEEDACLLRFASMANAILLSRRGSAAKSFQTASGGLWRRCSRIVRRRAFSTRRTMWRVSVNNCPWRPGPSLPGAVGGRHRRTRTMDPTVVGLTQRFRNARALSPCAKALTPARARFRERNVPNWKSLKP